jgi:hypothetical protein
MSSVLEFAPRPRDKSLRAAVGEDAEIIIFPGVRFERIDFDSDIFEPEMPHPTDAGQSQSRNRAAKS